MHDGGLMSEGIDWNGAEETADKCWLQVRRPRGWPASQLLCADLLTETPTSISTNCPGSCFVPRKGWVAHYGT